MKRHISKDMLAVLLTAVLALSLVGCGFMNQKDGSSVPSSYASSEDSSTAEVQENSETESSAPVSSSEAYSAEQIVLDLDSELFTDRDLTQTADLSEAVKIALTDGQTFSITEAGVYVLTGTAKNAEVIVEVGDEDKVQLVLDSLNVTNDSTPVIYVKNADKVFVTSAGSESELSVTGTFSSDGSTSTDAVIFSKDDLVLNGTGTVSITSSDNGVSCKDDLKVTGGTWNISCKSDALEANESISVGGGTLNINSSKDGLHAEYDEDNTTGWITVEGGILNITAADDGIHATTTVTVNAGELNITAGEGIEATQVLINDGDISINGKDDGINAGQKSKSMNVGITINGGYISINMGQGDTDAVDSNGYLTITGGTLDIYAQSPFDADGTVSYTGGDIYVNGSKTNSITNQMMGGGMMGGMQGGGMHGGHM